jgi:hypothetical protein
VVGIVILHGVRALNPRLHSAHPQLPALGMIPIPRARRRSHGGASLGGLSPGRVGDPTGAFSLRRARAQASAACVDDTHRHSSM